MSVEESQDRIHNALAAEASWLAENDKAYLLGWQVVVEWMDEDGERWLAQAAHKDSTAWQRMGYLTAALSTEREKWEVPTDG